MCRRHGRAVSFEHVAWWLEANPVGWMQIGFMPTSSDTDISGFQVGAGYTVETTKEQAAVWIADAVQTELADGTAVALIGELCAG